MLCNSFASVNWCGTRSVCERCPLLYIFHVVQVLFSLVLERYSFRRRFAMVSIHFISVPLNVTPFAINNSGSISKEFAARHWNFASLLSFIVCWIKIQQNSIRFHFTNHSQRHTYTDSATFLQRQSILFCLTLIGLKVKATFSDYKRLSSGQSLSFSIAFVALPIVRGWHIEILAQTEYGNRAKSDALNCKVCPFHYYCVLKQFWSNWTRNARMSRWTN